MLLKLFGSKFQRRLRTPVRAFCFDCIAKTLEMAIQLLVLEVHIAPVIWIGAYKLKLVQHFSIEFVYLTWSFRERIPTTSLIAVHIRTLRALKTDQVLAIYALDRKNHNIVTFDANQIFIKVRLFKAWSETGLRLIDVITYFIVIPQKCVSFTLLRLSLLNFVIWCFARVYSFFEAGDPFEWLLHR